MEYFGETARILFTLVADISRALGIRFEFVNMGGGIGIPYRPHQKRINLKELAKLVNDIYQDTVVKAGVEPLTLVTECGRVVTGPYNCLVTRVLHKKHTYKNFVGVDACMANLMRPGMYGAYHHISVIDKNWNIKLGTTEDNQNGYQNRNLEHSHIYPLAVYDVTGSLCENNDKFAVDRVLPEVEIGDIVLIHDAGAHGHSMGFNYNGKLRSAELLLKPNGDIEQIRRAETYQDLFATLDLSYS